MGGRNRWRCGLGGGVRRRYGRLAEYEHRPSGRKRLAALKPIDFEKVLERNAALLGERSRRFPSSNDVPPARQMVLVHGFVGAGAGTAECEHDRKQRTGVVLPCQHPCPTPTTSGAARLVA